MCDLDLDPIPMAQLCIYMCDITALGIGFGRHCLLPIWGRSHILVECTLRRIEQ